MAESFGTFLRDLRKNKQITIRDLAAASGVSATYITNIENGKRSTPSPAILKKLSEPLEIDYEFMMIRAGFFTENNTFVSYGTEDLPPDIHISNKVAQSNFLKHANDLKTSISFFMVSNNLHYNGHLLTKEEGYRVLKMLEALFPEYTNEKDGKS